jgi:hypothetical protein
MITGYAFAVVLCALILLLVFVLLRKRRLREKYAGIWIVVSLGVASMAIFPRFAFWLAGVARVTTPVNLLFALAAAVLLAVCIQLSTEVSTLEEETRTIAEELALLRLEVQESNRQRTAVPVPDQRIEPEDRALSG